MVARWCFVVTNVVAGEVVKKNKTLGKMFWEAIPFVKKKKKRNKKKHTKRKKRKEKQ